MVTIAMRCLRLLGLTTLLAACGAADTTTRSGMATYRSVEHDLSFTYDAELFLLERSEVAGNASRLAIVLVEDEPMNRAYLNGTLTAPMDGPPMITIDVYDNPDELSAAEWVAEHTNWILRDKAPELVEVGGRSFLFYFWDGLYAGKSAITVHDDTIAVFSVTWISEDDALVSQFSDLLSSVTLN